MLALRFEHPVNRQAYRVGPVPYFRIDGQALRAGPDDTVVASYQNGTWQINGTSYLTATAEAPARVDFAVDGKPGSGPLGPFAELKLVDGIMRHGSGFHQLLARFDEQSQSWYAYADQKHYPTVLLSTP
jgi:hypothetical protein